MCQHYLYERWLIFLHVSMANAWEYPMEEIEIFSPDDLMKQFEED